MEEVTLAGVMTQGIMQVARVVLEATSHTLVLDVVMEVSVSVRVNQSGVHALLMGVQERLNKDCVREVRWCDVVSPLRLIRKKVGIRIQEGVAANGVALRPRAVIRVVTLVAGTPHVPGHIAIRTQEIGNQLVTAAEAMGVRAAITAMVDRAKDIMMNIIRRNFAKPSGMASAVRNVCATHTGKAASTVRIM